MWYWQFIKLIKIIDVLRLQKMGSTSKRHILNLQKELVSFLWGMALYFNLCYLTVVCLWVVQVSISSRYWVKYQVISSMQCPKFITTNLIQHLHLQQCLKRPEENETAKRFLEIGFWLDFPSLAVGLAIRKSFISKNQKRSQVCFSSVFFFLHVEAPLSRLMSSAPGWSITVTFLLKAIWVYNECYLST